MATTTTAPTTTTTTTTTFFLFFLFFRADAFENELRKDQTRSNVWPKRLSKTSVEV